MGGPLSVSVVIPATRPAATLEACVAAVQQALWPGDEVLVQHEPVEGSPAAARNAGAIRAEHPIVVFVDADVLVHRDAIDRLRGAFAADPQLAACFGSYDDRPPGGLVGRFRNLLHHHVHQTSGGPAATFWAGLGAVRRDRFLAAGGFDTRRYPRAMLEDVELGLRLHDAGAPIRLVPEAMGTHLKEWSLGQMIRTDLRDRGVPWTRLLLERRRAPAVLNLGWRHRASAASVAATPPLLTAGFELLLLPCLALFLLLNRPFHALLWRRLGPVGALAGLGLHVVHHAVAIVALGVGTIAHVRRSHRPLPKLLPLGGAAQNLSEPSMSRSSGASMSR